MKFLKIMLLVFIVGCGGISVIDHSVKKVSYRPQFLQEVEQIKKVYRLGNSEAALKKLRGINEDQLEVHEKALIKNLIGVILFSQKNYEQAIFHFDQALNFSNQDDELQSLIHLNLSSCYYKLGHLEKSFMTLESARPEALNKKEHEKFHKLRYRLASELQKSVPAIHSLIFLLKGYETLDALKQDQHFDKLLSRFFSLKTQREKVSVLESYSDKLSFVIGYLTYLESEKRYYAGDKDGANDLLEWLRENYSKDIFLSKLVNDFSYRVEHQAKLDHKSIGIILPFKGKKESFSEQALTGIDHAIQNLNKQSEFKFIVRNSEGNPLLGAHHVRELVEKFQVGAIIGGLFKQEAKAEYLEAKKMGVMFVSLSPIFLPSEMKDHLLIEIPGSTESIMNLLFSKKLVEKFGQKGAIIYPEDSRGKAYIGEFWRQMMSTDVQLVNALSYEQGNVDYRDPVKNLLGLKFPRMRFEEMEMKKEIFKLEDKKSVRRKQFLEPVTEFDWVFMPAFPKEAIQLIPSFTYFDADKVVLIGGPSWRSKSLLNESYKYRNIYFIGENTSAETTEKFKQLFYSRYKRYPRLIEMMGYDAVYALSEIYKDVSFSSRDEMDLYVRALTDIKGQMGTWAQKNGVWKKEMYLNYLRKGKVQTVEL